MKCMRCGKVPDRIKHGIVIVKGAREEEKKKVRICPRCGWPVFENVVQKKQPGTETHDARGCYAS